MGSYLFGKPEVVQWIREHFDKSSEVLDVGAGDGIWHNFLIEFKNMDAIEVYKPNADKLTGYRHVFCEDIRSFEYEHYDLIIFGDVIEHMSVEDAQKVLAYAKDRCKDMIIAAPYLYVQGPAYGNQYEIHVQDDLTAENFDERYPGFIPLWKNEFYCYYRKGES